MGSIESRAAARALVASTEREKFSLAELGNLSLAQQALIEDVDNLGVAVWMVKLFRIALNRAKVYEMSLDWATPEVIRHDHAVAKEIDRMTGGQFSSLSLNGDERNRLKAIAEENLRSKQKR